MIRRISHEGGLLASFSGSAPRLGQTLTLPGGKRIGRVDTVLGSVDSPLVHIKAYDDIDPDILIGQPILIAPRPERNDRSDRRGQRDNRGYQRDRRDNRGGDRRGGDSRGGQRYDSRDRGDYRSGGDRRAGDRRDNRGGERGNRRDDRGRQHSGGNRQERGQDILAGDWICPSCKNHNYASRDVCNRGDCTTARPKDGGAGGGGGDRRGGDRRDNRGSDRRGSYQRDNRGGDRRPQYGGGRDGEGRSGGDRRPQSTGSDRRPPFRGNRSNADRKPAGKHWKPRDVAKKGRRDGSKGHHSKRIGEPRDPFRRR